MKTVSDIFAIYLDKIKKQGDIDDNAADDYFVTAAVLTLAHVIRTKPTAVNFED